MGFPDAKSERRFRMQMRKLASFAILAIGIAFIGSGIAAAQADQTQQPKKTFGYMDEKGVFHAPQAVPEASSSETLTGTLEVTFNITVKSSLAKGYVLLCSASFNAGSVNETTPTDVITYAEIGETSTTTTTCTVTIPYSWTVLPAGSTVLNSLIGSYTISAVNPSATTVATVTQWRLVGGNIVSTTSLPANGATTKYTIAVTI
jgi:hypothetical protein